MGYVCGPIYYSSDLKSHLTWNNWNNSLMRWKAASPMMITLLIEAILPGWIVPLIIISEQKSLAISQLSFVSCSSVSFLLSNSVRLPLLFCLKRMKEKQLKDSKSKAISLLMSLLFMKNLRLLNGDIFILYVSWF